MLWCSPAMPQIVPRQVLESTRLNSRKPLQSEEATTPPRSGLLEQTVEPERRIGRKLKATALGRRRVNRNVSRESIR